MEVNHVVPICEGSVWCLVVDDLGEIGEPGIQFLVTATDVAGFCGGLFRYEHHCCLSGSSNLMAKNGILSR